MNWTITQDGVPDRVYEAFRPLTYTDSGINQEVIAIALFDGDNDLYSVDPKRIPLAESEIVRMYVDDYDRPPSRLDIYTLDHASAEVAAAAMKPRK